MVKSKVKRFENIVGDHMYGEEGEAVTQVIRMNRFDDYTRLSTCICI